ncbi:Ejaculatory bulb-specific protein 3, partial [Trachymyrmex septentrionalis]
VRCSLSRNPYAACATLALIRMGFVIFLARVALPLFSVLALFLLVVAVVLADDKYTTKYDNVDLDTILASDRLLKNYVNCLLEKGSCTPDGKELKETLPDALATECSKCSEKQKKGTEKVVRYLVNKKPETWELLKKKYDPSGQYSIKYTDEAHKQGINV